MNKKKWFTWMIVFSLTHIPLSFAKIDAVKMANRLKPVMLEGIEVARGISALADEVLNEGEKKSDPLSFDPNPYSLQTQQYLVYEEQHGFPSKIHTPLGGIKIPHPHSGAPNDLMRLRQQIQEKYQLKLITPSYYERVSGAYVGPYFLIVNQAEAKERKLPFETLFPIRDIQIDSPYPNADVDADAENEFLQLFEISQSVVFRKSLFKRFIISFIGIAPHQFHSLSQEKKYSFQTEYAELRDDLIKKGHVSVEMAAEDAAKVIHLIQLAFLKEGIIGDRFGFTKQYFAGEISSNEMLDGISGNRQNSSGHDDIDEILVRLETHFGEGDGSHLNQLIRLIALSKTGI